MNEFSFSREEIESVAQDLGLPSNAFGGSDSERMKIINCWESRHVQACPGSGKTTVLLAKLLLLSRRMPFKDGRGVCVLTHTNVAIDEIRSQLGCKADILFQHPNFFGTIQSFVDRFLAIPSFKSQYHAELRGVDNSLQLQLMENVRWGILEQEPFRSIEYKKAIQEYFEANKERFPGLHFCEDADTGKWYLSNNIDGPKITINKPRKSKTGKDYSENIKQKIYDYLFSVKKTLHERHGVISYDDAYFYAGLYLKRYRVLSLSFSHRFKYVFVDEMQDTQKHQMDIIEKLFGEATIKQFYGDLDQAIFYSTEGGASAWQPMDSLQITGSKRFGTSIAGVAFNFSQHIARLDGNEKVESLEPHILLFKDHGKVLEKFASLIREYNLDKETWGKRNKMKPEFNAVGFVGKRDIAKKDKTPKVSIGTYNENFKKVNASSKKHFDSFISYFQPLPTDFIKDKGVSPYYDAIWRGLVHLLDNGKAVNPDTSRHFTKAAYEDFLRRNHEEDLNFINRNIAKWILEIHTEKKTAFQIREEVLTLFKEKLQTKQAFFPGCYNRNFVKRDDIEGANCVGYKGNIFEDKSSGISIQLGTIHYVKGKTHMATLLLATENDGPKDEANHFFETMCGNLFCGSRYRQPKSYTNIEKRLKTTYVALTRPTKLLCVALPVDKANCSTKCAEENTCKWKIINVD